MSFKNAVLHTKVTKALPGNNFLPRKISKHGLRRIEDDLLMHQNPLDVSLYDFQVQNRLLFQKVYSDKENKTLYSVMYSIQLLWAITCIIWTISPWDQVKFLVKCGDLFCVLCVTIWCPNIDYWDTVQCFIVACLCVRSYYSRKDCTKEHKG